MGETVDPADEVNRTRNYIRRRLRPLRTQTSRLLDHLDHMDAGDIDAIQAILERPEVKNLVGELKAIHDPEQCDRDREREGLNEPDEPEQARTIVGRLFDAYRHRR